MRYFGSSVAAAFVASALLAVYARAQSSAQNAEGITAGNYNIQQSIDFGYRFSDTNGNDAVYDTFVNLHSGPRILGDTLSIRSLNHEATIFDQLSFASSGWGGDPNNFANLNVSKATWYDFHYQFRRDQNVWDYDLFANPLNPPTSSPSIAITQSPHTYETRRRMYDTDLTLLPQSRVTFRLGYSRNRDEGPFFSTMHEGTETLLSQPYNTTTDSYRIGADLKLLPRTTISYDQFLQYDKNDTNYFDQAFPFQLSNGVPVDLGIVWDTANFSPCPSPVANGATTPPTANPTCDGYLQYTRIKRERAFIPTEQLSVRSSYFKRVELVAQAGYSNSQVRSPFSELFRGNDSFFTIAQSLISGPAAANRVAAWSEFGVTIDVTQKLHIQDRFRYSNFNVPGVWNSATTNLFYPTLPGSMLNSPCPATPTTCAQHNDNSPPDLAAEPFIRFLGENRKWNEFQVQYDFSNRIGARIGYRYAHRLVHNRFFDVATETFFPSDVNRNDCAGVPLNPDGSCSVVLPPDSEDNIFDINEHTAIAGIWARPTDQLRMNFDVEALTADNFVTRISPRQQQRYRFGAHYQPRPWATLSFSGNLQEGRNGLSEIDYRAHNRNFSFSADVAPNERYGLSAAYTYNNTLQNANICFVSAAPPAGAGICAEDPTAELQMFSFYQDHTHYGSATIYVKPVKRLTVNAGYSIVSNNGDALLLNPLQPTAQLDFSYHQPLASVAFEINKNLVWNTAWNYYGYFENSLAGPTLPRNFHANLAAFFLTYKF